MLNRRQVAAAALAVGAPLPALAQAGKTAATPAEIPIESFFAPPQLSGARLSPGGGHVGLLVGGDGGRRRLVVLDLATMKSTPVVALQETDVLEAHWVNDRRLIARDGIEDSNSDDWRRSSFYAVDVDGENFKRLGPAMALVRQPLDLGDEVLITEPSDRSEGWGFLRLWRLNTRSGARREIELPAWTFEFLVNPQGEPVAALTGRGEKLQVRARDERGVWQQLRETARYFGETFSFEGLAGDGSWWVAARQGHDQSALYRFDPKQNRLADKPQLALAGFDISPSLIEFEDRLVGAQVLADARTTVWFDPGFKGLQAKIDAKLPATANLIQPPRRGDSPWLLVWAYSDRRPGRALLFNRQTEKLTLLGSERPQIDPALMSAMDYTPYKARDGRTIPAYLTLPSSAGEKRPLPLIVLVHGGPHVRGSSWAWDAEVQLLASRGYAVLQPEYRGSDGFGEAHLRAGFRQWGQAMQDDLADGVAWAVKQGIADPKRVAIFGGSYGGYAAMMGLVRHPELYRCAVNLVGVTDLQLMFSAHWSDVPGVAKRLGFGQLIGDPVKDAELLKANSPVHQAQQIRKPVLMAYGRYDERVPREHGERMRDALKGHNEQLEWVLYDKEGHGWYRMDTKKDFWGRVERFLAKHLSS